MALTKITNPIHWDNTSSRITVFPVLQHKNVAITTEFASGIWPTSKDAILKTTTSSAETGQINLEGEFRGRRLLLTVTPFKIDLILEPKEQLNLTSVSLRTMGSYSEAINDVNQLAEVWLTQDSLPHIQRLAFAPELVSRAKSHADAYNMISQYLPFSVDPQTSSDFRYQINKFTTSEVIKGLRINRVTAWDVLRFNFQFSIGQLTQPPLTYDELFYCHLSLDVNTDSQLKGQLNRDNILLLFRELASQVDKIRKEGIK